MTPYGDRSERRVAESCVDKAAMFIHFLEDIPGTSNCRLGSGMFTEEVRPTDLRHAVDEPGLPEEVHGHGVAPKYFG